MRRRLPAFLAAAAALICAGPVAASCEIRKALYDEAAAICEKDKSYCGDVDLYRADVLAECGASALAAETASQENRSGDGDGGSAGEGASGQSSSARTGDQDDGDGGQTPPRSCAYFTKPANEQVRLNYHQPESTVCWNGSAYQCVTDPQGIKYWLKRAPCSVFQGLPDACKVEGTC